MFIQVPTPVQYNLKMSMDKSVVVDKLMVLSNGEYTEFLPNTVLPLNQMSDIECVANDTYTANVAMWVLKQRKKEFINSSVASQEEIAELVAF